jgi:hypothetical protein
MERLLQYNVKCQLVNVERVPDLENHRFVPIKMIRQEELMNTKPRRIFWGWRPRSVEEHA